MSKNEFKRFCNVIHHDDNLQIRVRQIIHPAALIEMGEEKGFSFTFEEIVEGLRELNDWEEEKKKFVKDLKSISGLPPLRGIDEENINDAGMLGLEYFSEDIRHLAEERN